jgi:hypothetical protein
MSFLSSFFALPVSEFPKGADDSSNALPLNWVSKYICMFTPLFSILSLHLKVLTYIVGITLAVATFFIYIALDVTRVVKRIREIGHATARLFRPTAETKAAQIDGAVPAKPTTILIERERLSQLYHRDTGQGVPNTPQHHMAQAHQPNIEQPSLDFVEIIALDKADEESTPPAVSHIQLRTPRQLEEGMNNVSQRHSNAPQNGPT